MENRKTLREKLQALPCHFTWDFEFEDQADVEHLLKYLTLQVKHTLCQNRDTYVTMKAFLYHHQRRYSDALKSLREAEHILAQDHPDNLLRQAVLTYGNYAWIYYHLSNYKMVQRYLDHIAELGRSLCSPHPFPTGLPEILAQKGWSLLVAGVQRGVEAKECFEGARRRDPSNNQLQTGLAMALYAAWEHLQSDPYREKATEMLEEVVLHQPENFETKIYLARLLLQKDEQRARTLLEEVAERSLNPEVLRRAAKLCLRDPPLLSRAISILKKAIALDSSYHILYYDLGMCYKAQMEGASPERKSSLLTFAGENFHQAVQMNAFFVDPMLELATIYGEGLLAYEEEIYAHLVEEAPNISKQCLQALYLQWGDFLLQKKNQKQEALEKYMAGICIAGGLGKKLLVRRLMSLAHMFWEDSQTARADTIYSFLQTVHYEEPGPGSEELWWHNHRALR
nr:interferon-induced protein with tetratricopeptide repeats 2-like isoform X1 [Pogona vitticeps]